MTIAAAIASGAQRLLDAGIETPRLDAEILMRHLLQIDRTQLFVRLREPFDADLTDSYDRLIERKIAGVPVSYLTGRREFMGMSFMVGPGVLTPRPETELMVERAIDWLATRSAPKVLDVGTGSGAIAISVAKLRPAARVIAIDESEEALHWAETNRTLLEAPVSLVLGDLVAPLRGPFDLVLANLPYLRPDQLASNPELRAEPEMALVSGLDGLDLIRRLIKDLPRIMVKDGAIALEIDPSQACVVARLAGDQFPNARIKTHDDLAGYARHVWIFLA